MKDLKTSKAATQGAMVNSSTIDDEAGERASQPMELADDARANGPVAR
jgi:hypothetical protein